MHRNIGKVFGREEDREHIRMMLRNGPDTYAASTSTSRPYSVIGIHGVTGSGKSTLAQYVCDYEKQAGHFDPVLFIHVGETFSVGGIFRDMLKQIKQSRSSTDKELKSLKIELWENLKGKRFLLVLDDVWANDDNLKEQDILLDTLNAAQSGSRILVTAQKTDAAQALGAQEQFAVPDLKEEVYLSLLMNHARPHAANDYGQYERIGRKIANRLCRSGIAAVTVGKQLQRNKSISFWEITANLDVLGETMGALWWSYQQLAVDIRRCFAYLSTFPRGYRLKQDELVRIWIAQGFVDTRNNATEELEDVGQHYFNELLTFSFLEVQRRTFLGEKTVQFTIHDLLHKLAERVSGSEFFRIGLNNGPPKDIPQGVCHLFIETNHVAEMVDKMLDYMGNLRTLIINEASFSHVYELGKMICRMVSNDSLEDVAEIREKSLDLGNSSTRIINENPYERPIIKKHDLEKVLGRLFMGLKKLRVLIIKLNFYDPLEIENIQELLFPASIDQMKHLRYLGFRFRDGLFDLILPTTVSKLYHIQTIDIDCRQASGPEHMANLISAPLSFPNMGKLMSLQTLKVFTVKDEQGYELKQLKHLNKLRGSLSIQGLEFVRSKGEALEAHHILPPSQNR